MPASNDGREGSDPKAISALDCFAPGLAMTTARPRQPPRLHSLASLTARTPRNSQIDIIPHCSLLIPHCSLLIRQPDMPQFGRNRPQSAAQGIEAELRSVATRSVAIGAESPTRRRRDAPKNQKGKQDLKPNTAISRVCRAPLTD
jgi:hypothetical protein